MIKRASLRMDRQCKALLNYIHVAIFSLVNTPYYLSKLKEPLTKANPEPNVAVQPSQLCQGYIWGCIYVILPLQIFIMYLCNLHPLVYVSCITSTNFDAFFHVILSLSQVQLSVFKYFKFLLPRKETFNDIKYAS